MQRRIRLLSLLVLLSTSLAHSQNLPWAFNFSTDGNQLLRGGVVASDLFDESVVDTIYLVFAQPDYWNQMTNNYEDKIEILASLSYKGDFYDSVGVRFRGQTSYMQNNTDKKSFNIEMDFAIDGQDIDGYDNLNLLNCYDDPSFIREVLYFNMCRDHIPAPKGSFVNLQINGEDWGLYANVQQLDAQHVEDWYLDKESTRWRGEGTSSGGGPGGPGGPGGSGFGAGESTLNYNSPDSTDYTENYVLKKSYKDDPWQDLINACDALNNTPATALVDSLSKVFDIDAALWYLAHEILFTDQDSYVGKGGMDYFIYFDEATGRLVPQVYDGNSCIQVNQQQTGVHFTKKQILITPCRTSCLLFRNYAKDTWLMFAQS